ncbi:MAG: leucine-rich repeat domain-containing protein [Acholeplasmatales bacterium]|nr:leucine-rich repeat domain-containing protein [Acholeplasmatales bacterium]
MKKFFKLLALGGAICAVGVATACNDDDSTIVDKNITYETITTPENQKAYQATIDCSGLLNAALPDRYNDLDVYSVEVVNGETLTSFDFKNTSRLIKLGGCSKLTSIDISGFDVVDSGALRDCTAATTVRVKELRFLNQSATGDSYLTYFSALYGPTYTAEDGSTQPIPQALQKVYVESGDIDKGFTRCDTLKEVELSLDVKTIGTGAFEGLDNLESVKTSCTSIESGAFTDCPSLKTVDLGKNLTSLGANAFSNCTALESITLPDTLTSLEKSVFDGCTALTSVDLGDSIESINLWAFDGCTSLSELYIPGSVKTIIEPSYDVCSIQSIYYEGGYDDWAQIEFDSQSLSGEQASNYLDANVYFRYEGTSYVTASNGSRYATCEELSFSNVSEINDYAFAGDSNIKSIIFSRNVETIGNYAFANCENLEYIVILNDDIKIHTDAFYSCTKLTKVLLVGDPASLIGLTAPVSVAPFVSDFASNTFYFYTPNNGNETESGNWWYFSGSEPVCYTVD